MPITGLCKSNYNETIINARNTRIPSIQNESVKFSTTVGPQRHQI